MLALFVVIGAGVGIEASIGVMNVATRIDQIAVSAAATGGDPHPTSVTWVETDNYGTGYHFGGLDQPVQQVQPAETVYILEIQGHYVLGPAGAATTPVFSVMQVIVNADTFTVGAISASNDFGSLTGYGTPETDSLIGVGSG